MAWTDERIEQLRQMWQQGLTASQIADALGGVSRNAVIGKAHRLGLQARPSPVRAGETASVEEAAEPPFVVEAEAPAVVSEPVQPAVPLAADEPAPSAATPAVAAPAPDAPLVRSIGPGGFQRQNPHEQQVPIPPAPPRRLVPAKPSADIAGKTGLLDLNDRICKWPLGHPGEPDFHFCGNPVNPGFPYCLDHCSVAYQAQLPRRDRRPPPPLPYGGPRVR
jgi:GcrA cell cycle regulator